MEFATGLKLSWKKEKLPRSVRDPWRTGNMRSWISMEIILRPVLSIFMCMARLAATRWKPRLKRFALFAISTRVAARHHFCSRQQQRLSTRSSRCCKRFATIDPRSVQLSVFMSKGHLFRKRKPERNASSSLRTRATAGAGLREGSQFALFGKDCIVENGVCLLADHSALAGSNARMIDLVGKMGREVNVPLNEAIAMATENPARAIGLETKGRLIVGADADLVVLSPQIEAVRTFAAGREVWSD